eukprot:768759-Hanusia_phi.AAC.21
MGVQWRVEETREDGKGPLRGRRKEWGGNRNKEKELDSRGSCGSAAPSPRKCPSPLRRERAEHRTCGRRGQEKERARGEDLLSSAARSSLSLVSATISSRSCRSVNLADSMLIILCFSSSLLRSSSLLLASSCSSLRLLSISHDCLKVSPRRNKSLSSHSLLLELRFLQGFLKHSHLNHAFSLLVHKLGDPVKIFLQHVDPERIHVRGPPAQALRTSPAARNIRLSLLSAQAGAREAVTR